MQWRFHPFHFAVSGNENEMAMRFDKSFVDQICLKILSPGSNVQVTPGKLRGSVPSVRLDESDRGQVYRRRDDGGADPKTGQFVFIIADEEKRSLAF